MAAPTGNKNNPNGRPVLALSFANMLRSEFEKKIRIKDSKKRIKGIDALIQVAKQNALSGDLEWVKLVLDRLYGRPKETLEIEKPAEVTPFSLEIAKLRGKE